jgi:hypothetical protein
MISPQRTSALCHKGVIEISLFFSKLASVLAAAEHGAMFYIYDTDPLRHANENHTEDNEIYNQ